MRIGNPNTLAPRASLAGLPAEIVKQVLQHFISPVDIINLSSTDRAHYHVVIKQHAYWWALHGTATPTNKDTTSASVWTARVRTVPAEVRRTLPQLNRPMDVLDDEKLAELDLFCRHASAIESMTASAEQHASCGNPVDMHMDLSHMKTFATRQGLPIPRLSEPMRAAYLTSIKAYGGECEPLLSDEELSAAWSQVHQDAQLKALYAPRKR
jgi:hypothetical protein